MARLVRGQRVIATHARHGSHAGEIAIMSSNGIALGVLLDEPYADRRDGGMLVAGAIMLTRKGEIYLDFWDEEWTLVAQEFPEPPETT